jgi:ubiquinone/menaquinone biosynthesis C-methylase UbiE
MALVEWIMDNIKPREVTTGEMYYYTESQSGRKLPLIYLPFDPDSAGDWADRGDALDFAITSGGGDVLDFGPGDGWPALVIAPMVKSVVGVEGSKKRVEVCTSNAERMGIENATFIFSQPGEKLPFEDGCFDAIVAASSIEETPYPYQTLHELFRCLRNGGALRLRHQAYVEHVGRPAIEIVGPKTDGERTWVDIWDRQLDKKWVRHIRLYIDLHTDEAKKVLGQDEFRDDAVSISPLLPHLTDAAVCVRKRPSGTTFMRWLTEIGFSSVESTYDGGWFARRIFHQIPTDRRPKTVSEIDNLLRPMVEVVVRMPKPVENDGTITAVK